MEISLSAIVAQIINFGIMFRLFRKFAAQPLAKAIENRRKLVEKLQHADNAYHQKIEEAKQKAQSIIKEANKTKDAIIQEASIMANKKQKEILEEAKQKAQSIIKEAEKQAEKLQKDMEKDFEISLKRTSMLVVKKLLEVDQDIQSKYLDTIIKDLQN